MANIPALQQALQQAQTALLSDPQYQLLPWYRRAIYQAFSSLTYRRVLIARAWLGILTAQYVLPRWNQAWPEDTRPDELLQLVIGVVHGTSPPQSLLDVHQYAQWIRDQDYDCLTPPQYQGFFAMLAILEARNETLGMFKLEGRALLTPSSVDEDMGLYFGDTARWAAVASVSEVDDSITARAERRAFWEWWLGTAIPQAWSYAIMPDNKPLDTNVEQAINAARQALSSQALGLLDLQQRQQIDKTFGGSWHDLRARQTKGWLALIGAYKVLPLWTHLLPDEHLLDDLVIDTFSVLQGLSEPFDLLDDVAAAEEYLPTAIEPLVEADRVRAYYVASAVITSLREVIGFYPISESEVMRPPGHREERSQMTRDTAYWAELAVAGRDPQVAVAQRREFWEWWLAEAVPDAWHQVYS